MPERESAGDEESDENADEKENTVCGQSNEEEGHYGYGCEQSGRALQAKTEAGPGHTGIILTLRRGVEVSYKIRN